MASQPRSRRRSSSRLIARRRTRLFSCQPVARTSSIAITALAVLPTTAMNTPTTEPNNSPAANVNAVRGNGGTVTTVCTSKNASGNHAPSDLAQSRNSTAVGTGTSSATTTSTVIPTTVPTMRGSDA